MGREYRLCELETLIIRETRVYNGGIKVVPTTRNGELTAIKVINTNYISGTSNDNLEVNDEWLYTVYVRDGLIHGGIADAQYVKFINDLLGGVRVLDNSYIG